MALKGQLESPATSACSCSSYNTAKLDRCKYIKFETDILTALPVMIAGYKPDFGNLDHQCAGSRPVTEHPKRMSEKSQTQLVNGEDPK